MIVMRDSSLRGIPLLDRNRRARGSCAFLVRILCTMMIADDAQSQSIRYKELAQTCDKNLRCRLLLRYNRPDWKQETGGVNRNACDDAFHANADNNVYRNRCKSLHDDGLYSHCTRRMQLLEMYGRIQACK